ICGASRTACPTSGLESFSTLHENGRPRPRSSQFRAPRRATCQDTTYRTGGYRTETVAVLEAWPPTVITSGCWPVGVSAATSRLACARPTRPGVRPRNRTLAAAPPMVAVAVLVACARGLADAACPVGTVKESGPTPVKYAMRTPPCDTGLPGPLRLKSWFCAAA